MSGHESPIVVWRLGRWSSAPIRYEFARETEKFYFHPNGRRVAKSDTYGRYYESEEAALAALQSRRDSEAARRRAEKLAAAAPKLLAFAQSIANNVVLAGSSIGAEARAAIAEATGESA